MSGKHFELADAYAAAVQNAASMGIAAEPEAQLTVPVERLFRDVAAEAGLGELTLVRGARLNCALPGGGRARPGGLTPLIPGRGQNSLH